jgi:HEAT repeat protein
MMDSLKGRLLLTACIAMAGTSCGGGESEGAPASGGSTTPAPAVTQAPKPTGGFDLGNLRGSAPPAEITSNPTPTPATTPSAGDTPVASKPADAPAPAPAPSSGKEVPTRIADITDKEVLASWGEDEREALEEMEPTERAEFMETRRKELFLARGGVLVADSGRMEDQAVDAASGMRGDARPDAPQKDLPPPDLAAILGALASSDPETRAAGADMARRYPDAAVAVKHMLEVLDDKDPDVRSIAISTLGDLKRPEAIPGLKKVIDKDRKDEVRVMAIAALAKIGGEEAIATLRAIVRESDEPANRAAALYHLIETGKAVHVADLVPRAMADFSADVRRHAAVAMRTYQLKEHAPHMVPLFNDISDLVAIEAIRTAGELGLRSTVGHIIKILVEPDPESDLQEPLQDAANRALEQITGEKKGYDGTQPDELRLAAIDSWRLWWEKSKGTWE